MRTHTHCPCCNRFARWNHASYETQTHKTVTVEKHEEPDNAETVECIRVPLWLILVLAPCTAVVGAFAWSLLFAILEVMK